MSRGLRTIFHSERWKSEDFTSWPSMLSLQISPSKVMFHPSSVEASEAPCNLNGDSVSLINNPTFNQPQTFGWC
ncbi:MAG: hypothetical protein ACTS53_01820 [Candidatus Hodgkinia cicadicola]